MNTCPRCGVKKEISEFYRSSTYCKPCLKSYVTDRRKTLTREQISAPVRRWQLKNKDKVRDYRRAWKTRYLSKDSNLIKEKARKKLGSAVQAGSVTKPTFCEECGTDTLLQGHHYNGYDSDNWRKVRWLCARCHTTVHLVIK